VRGAWCVVRGAWCVACGVPWVDRGHVPDAKISQWRVARGTYVQHAVTARAKK
jgi:hypothetical protein